MNLPGWEARPLGRCARFLSGGTPSKNRSEFWEGDIPWVSSGEMTEVYINDTPLHISAEAAEEGSRIVPSNTVLAVVRGMSLAKEFRVAITKRDVAFNQDLKAFACEPDIESEFLFYALLARREHIRDLATEASHGTKKLETEVLARFPILVPKPDVQRKIVVVISSYDALIENNRRRMELLEEAARQLYREWFVRLRFPGCEHTRIINGVPEGWCLEKVGNVLAKIESKKKIPKESYLPEGPVPCVDQSAEFIGGFTDDEDAVYSQPLPIIVFGDHTRVLKFVNFPFARGADGTQIVYPNTDRIGSEYLYFALKEIDLSNYFYARHFKFLKEEEVFLPEASLGREFTMFARPCFEQIQTLRLQNQKLRAARDLLLPRLMSGEIAV
jgi:type I restriction enzyme, S subunit